MRCGIRIQGHLALREASQVDQQRHRHNGKADAWSAATMVATQNSTTVCHVGTRTKVALSVGAMVAIQSFIPDKSKVHAEQDPRVVLSQLLRTRKTVSGDRHRATGLRSNHRTARRSSNRTVRGSDRTGR